MRGKATAVIFLSLFVWFVPLFLFCASASAQESNKPLPNVLIIGDSISMGYTPFVKEMLADEANVSRPNTNCGPTTKGLEQLSDWLGDTKWDVIHFNHGLHDLKYLGPGGENLADPNDSKNHQQVPPDEYRRNLQQIVERLKATGAELVWCATTAVPEGAKGRVPGDAQKYNEIAHEIMVENGITVNDLFDVSKFTLGKTQRPANVHFTKDGSHQLAQHVSAHIQAALTRHHVDDQTGFEPLFNGKSLDGWVNVNCAPNTWSVKDGMIYCTGKPIGELRTDKMYQNFVLDLEWRHLKPKGNAGVFVWADSIPAVGQPFHRGVEVQVLDGREADWYTSDGDIFPIHGATMKPRNDRGGDRAFPTEPRSKDSPEWNSYRIVCVDGSIALAVNGKFVTHGEYSNPRKGYICLESEGSPVEFRDIKIRELTETVIDQSQVAMDQQGFRTLYTGIDLEGWEVAEQDHGAWKTTDWRLVFNDPDYPDSNYVETAEEFEDFDLVIDYRISKDKEHDGDYGSIFARGFEVEFLPGSPAKSRGQWNRILISANGRSFSGTVSGAQLGGVSHDDSSSGKIRIMPGNHKIEFANILIREK